MKSLIYKLHGLIKGFKVPLLLCFCCMIFWGGIYYPKWNKKYTEATISYDASGYYLYLPAIFIYKDLKQVGFLNEIQEKYSPSPAAGQVFEDEGSGNKVMKYSAGQALHYLPWFFVGHLISKATPYPSDGFSYPYQASIGVGMLLYAFIGLFFLGLILREYFNNLVVGLTLISIVFASNYLEYGAISGAMTHNTLFTNYCILIYLSINFYKNPKYLTALGIGLFVGLNALTRPTEIISLIIPLLWGLNLLDFDSLYRRFKFIKDHLIKYISAILICTAIGSIQIIYWKYVSNQWLVYSYEDQGFSWTNPHFIEGIFSIKTGWLVYSPIMILSLIGFLFLFKNKSIFYSLFLFSMLFVYICFAWDIWWYGGSLGQRAMVQSYPILAFPLAAFIQQIQDKRQLRLILYAFLISCIFYNFWLTHHAHKGGILKPGQMTKPYLSEVLFESEVEIEKLKLLDTDELFKGERYKVIELYDHNQESINNSTFKLEGHEEYTPIIKASINNEKDWVRCKAKIKLRDKEWVEWAMTQMIIQFFYKGEQVKYKHIKVQRLVSENEEKEIFIDSRIPKTSVDSVGLFFWNAGKTKAVEISNIKIESFNEDA